MYYFKAGENRKGVILQQYEIEMLTLIYNHRLLTTKQLHTWVKQSAAITYKSFYNRMKKLANMDLVVEHEYSLGQKGFYFKYYRIGSKGLEIIIDNQKLPDKIIRDISRFSHVKNIDHFLSTQELIIHALVHAEEHIQALSPFDNVETLEKDFPSVIPDWIVKSSKQTIYLELDTGSEANAVIKEKAKKYLDLCESNPTSSFVVFFSVLDSSFPSRYSYGHRTKRIANLKHTLKDLLGHKVPNLEVYVVPFARSKPLLLDIIAAKAPNSKGQKKIETELAILTLDKLNSSFPYQFSKMDMERYYPSNVEEYYRVDGVYQVSHGGSNTAFETLAVLLMEEGNVHSLNRLDFTHHFIRSGRFKKKVDRLLLVYKRSEELERDLIGKAYNSVLLGSMEKWGNDLDNEPLFYKQISPYKKEIVKYDN